MPDRAVPSRVVVPASASPEEAAAVVAAVERFLREHAVAAGPAAPPEESGWLRAARDEAVDRMPSAGAGSGFGQLAAAWPTPER